MKTTTMFLKGSIFAVIALCVPAFAVSGLAQTSAQPAVDAFTWSGELVSLDENTRVLTVKTRVVGDQPRTELPKFKAGEKMLVTWSGYDKYADAINRAVHYDATKKSQEKFTFPAEFVAFDAAHQYLTFKVPVPQDSIAKIRSLKPGEWITATSPHARASESQPIVSLRPYVSSSKSSETAEPTNAPASDKSKSGN